jgi:hypothetical protein
MAFAVGGALLLGGASLAGSAMSNRTALCRLCLLRWTMLRYLG